MEKFNDAAFSVADCPAKLVRELKDATVFTDLNGSPVDPFLADRP
jgi:hypothetical protein